MNNLFSFIAIELYELLINIIQKTQTLILCI